MLYVRGKYARLMYTRYKNISRMIAVLIVFFAVNEKRNLMKKNQNETVKRQRRDSVTVSNAIASIIRTPL